MDSCGSSSKKKRVRAPNFTDEEACLLLRLTLREKHILENKKTDSEMWKLKDETWSKIADTFNSASGKLYRSSETLRSKYDVMKKNLKKKVNKNKAETMKTGGGTPNYIDIEGPERELLEVLSLSISGLPSQYDSDSVLPQTTITGEANETPQIEDEPTEQNELPDGFDESQLITEPFITSEDILLVNVNEVEEQLIDKKVLQRDISSCRPENTVEDKPERKRSWTNWSPAGLRTKKHPALTPRGTNTKVHLNNKIEKNLELREELFNLQILHSKNNETRAKEKHEKDIELQILHANNEEIRAKEKHEREMELLALNILTKKRELEKFKEQ